MMRQTIRFPSACYKLHFFLATFAFLFVSFGLYFKCYLTGSQQLIVDINCFVFERKAWVQLQQLQLRLFSLWEMQLSTCTGTAMQYHTIQSNTIPCDTIQCHAIQGWPLMGPPLPLKMCPLLLSCQSPSSQQCTTGHLQFTIQNNFAQWSTFDTGLLQCL